jgi:sigma-B regulation protein RsbU (phosphoserine phosphatase)
MTLKFFRFHSIQSKIFAILFLIPSITLSCFLWLASEIFSKDKKSYIYDSSLKDLNLTASLMEKSLAQNWDQLKPLVSSLKEKAPLEKRAELEKFVKKNQILYFSFPTDRIAVGELGRYGRTADQLIKKASGQFKTELLPEGVLAFMGVVEGSPVIFLQKFSALPIPSADRIQNSYLFDTHSKEVLSVGSSALSQQTLQEIISSRGLEQQRSQAFEINSTGTADSLFVTTGPIGDGALSLLVVIEGADLFESLNSLLRQSFGLYLILLGLSLLIGFLFARRLTQPILDLTHVSQLVSQGDFSQKTESRSQDEIGILSQSFNRMSDEIQNLLKLSAEKGRMQNELMTAKILQDAILPKGDLTGFLYALAGYSKTASECGGDYWHYFETPESLHLLIGDVTGHGAAAALMTAAAHAGVISISQTDCRPDEALKKLDQIISATGKNQFYMTMLWIRYDKIHRSLSFSNAGHEGIYILPLQPGANLSHKDSRVEMGELCRQLGLEGEETFQSSVIPTQKDQVYLIYTDGLFDLKNSQGKTLQPRAFLNHYFLLSQSTKDLQAIRKGLIQLIDDFCQGQELLDDVTFVLARFEPE